MKLKEYLRREKITEEHFAAMIGYTSSTINKIITGARAPSVRLAREIEKITDGEVTVGEILECKPEKVPCPCCHKLISTSKLEKLLRNTGQKIIR